MTGITWPTGDDLVAYFKLLGGVPDIGVYHQWLRPDNGLQECRMCAVGVICAAWNHVPGNDALPKEGGDYDQDELVDVLRQRGVRLNVVKRVLAVDYFEKGAWAADLTGYGPAGPTEEQIIAQKGRREFIPAEYLPDWDAGYAAWAMVREAVKAGELPDVSTRYAEASS